MANMAIDYDTQFQQGEPNSRDRYPLFIYNAARDETTTLVFHGELQIDRFIYYLSRWLGDIVNVNESPCDTCEFVKKPNYEHLPLLPDDDPPF